MPIYHLEVISPRPFKLGPSHTPYMVLPRGGTGPFSCAFCVALDRRPNGEFHCKSEHYQAFMGTSLLVDADGKPLDDPSRACSDWYTPNLAEIGR